MVRNLVIFTAVVLSSGWLGHGLNRLMGVPPEQSLGMLLWLVAPLVTALLLRAFAGEGWKDFGLRPAPRGHRRWYLVSLLLMPAIALGVLALGLRGLAGHGLVGLIWGLWHVPYFVFFLGPAQVEASAAQGLATFVPAAVVSMVAASIAYGELRLLTASVWPAVLMHTAGNAFTDILVAKGFDSRSSRLLLMVT